MPDLPIQPPPAPIPPRPVTPPEEDSADSLDSLSPFNVLQKKGASSIPVPPPMPSTPSSPPVGVPVPPPASAPSIPPTPISAASLPTPSREELLKQAAEAPKDSFILPVEDYRPTTATPDKIASAQVVGTVPPPPPVTPPVPPKPPVPQTPTPSQMVEVPKPMERPAFKPLPPVALPPAPRAAVPKMPPPPVPLTTKVTKSVPAPGFGAQPRSKAGLYSVIGVLVVLVIFGAAGYILAAGGARVPVFYTMISGQNTNGTQVMRDMAAAIKAEKSYTLNTQVKISPKTSGEQQALPTSEGTSTQVSSILSLSEASLYEGDVFTGQESISINGGSSLDVALETTSSENWFAYFPEASTPTVVSASPSELNRTLLYPALKPMSLEDYANAATSLSKPAKRLSKDTDITVSAYNVTAFDESKLSIHLPVDAKITSATGIVEVSWKGKPNVANRPVRASLDMNFTYKGTDYTLKEVWEVTTWSAALDTAKNPDLKNLAERNKAVEAPTMSTTSFIGQLGIGSLSLLPNTIDASTAVTDSGGLGTVTPTGEVITVVGTAITVIPAAPDQPAGEEAIKRDTQRKSDLVALQTALEGYKKDNERYPVSGGLVQTVSSSTLFDALVPKYLTAMPVDPLKSTYWYEYESDGSTFTLRSVLEDASDTLAKKGTVFSYYELVNK